ncbi:MAG: hypothetical protein IJY31_05020 [Muribaculaceae bacterium]|nr:hypothetical protein [Muribaculaceae bacterium]
MNIFHPRTLVLSPEFSHLEEFMLTIPERFRNNEGTVIHKGRNELREFKINGIPIVVKSFRIPNIINRIAYGFLRQSKAQRSYIYAKMLLKNGIGTPAPIGYYTERKGFFFSLSYYACLKSECTHTYIDLIKSDYPNQEKILRAIARVTARIHELKWIHKDYSRGNILFKETSEGNIKLEIIDLNRIRFQKVNMKKGCKNFERLPGSPKTLRILANEYAKARGFNPDKCYEIILANRERQRN